MDYQKQVENHHYSFKNYIFLERWISYWYQLIEIFEVRNISNILDIGPGTNLLRHVLSEHNANVKYQSLDIDESLKPDIVGSVTSIPVPDESFDCVTAFQILEHIRFEDFETALKEIRRVTKNKVIISLPHFGPQFTFQLKIPFLPKIQFAFKIPWPSRLVFNGQHYWEVGRKGYSPKKIRKVIENHFVIEKEFIPFEYQYHRFYVLNKKE